MRQRLGPPDGFDATLGTGVSGLLYIIVVGAICVFCSICAFALIFIGRRRQRRVRNRRRRQYERARSKTSLTAYSDVLEDERRKLTNPGAYDAVDAQAALGRKDSKAPVRKDSKRGSKEMSALAKKPRQDRRLPELSRTHSNLDDSSAKERDMPALKRSASGAEVKARSRTSVQLSSSKNALSKSKSQMRMPSPSAPPARELTDSKAEQMGLPVIKLDDSAPLDEGANDTDFRTPSASKHTTPNVPRRSSPLAKSRSAQLEHSSSKQKIERAQTASSVALSTSAAAPDKARAGTSATVTLRCSNCDQAAAAKVRIGDKKLLACMPCARVAQKTGAFPKLPSGSPSASPTTSAATSPSGSAVRADRSAPAVSSTAAPAASPSVASAAPATAASAAAAKPAKRAKVCTNCGSKAKVELKIGGERKLACLPCSDALRKTGKWPEPATPAAEASAVVESTPATKETDEAEKATAPAEATHADLPDEPPPEFDATHADLPDDPPPPAFEPNAAPAEPEEEEETHGDLPPEPPAAEGEDEPPPPPFMPAEPVDDDVDESFDDEQPPLPDEPDSV